MVDDELVIIDEVVDDDDEDDTLDSDEILIKHNAELVVVVDQWPKH